MFSGDAFNDDASRKSDPDAEESDDDSESVTVADSRLWGSGLWVGCYCETKAYLVLRFMHGRMSLGGDASR